MRYALLSLKTFGRLKQIEKIGTKHDSALWLCGCRCGNYSEKSSGELTRKKNPRTSCGFCLDHERYPKEYIIWRNIKSRCQNVNDKSYQDYGAKGIDMCREWREDFLNFLEYIGIAPGPDYTLDRIDSTKHYEPGNVRWATREIQNLNKCNVNTLRAKLKLRLAVENNIGIVPIK